MRRIAFVNEKGGTCKTTLAVNLAAYLAREGRRVLIVDLDTQGHAGKSLGCDVREVKRTVYDLLTNETLELADVVQPTSIEGLDLVPANKALAEYPFAVAQDRARETRLMRRIETLSDEYDYVVIDSPPSAGLFLTSALLAATDVVIPVATTYLALDGCAEVVSTIDMLREKHGREDLQVAMVVPTLYRKTVLADEVMAKLREYFPETLAATALTQSIHLDEAQGHGQSIWEYAPRSKGAKMMQALGAELLARLEGSRKSKSSKRTARVA